MGKIKVTKAGPMTTIQDEGRFGYRRYGIPQSGAMDLNAMHQANYLVGNEPRFPVIEHALTSLALEMLTPTGLAVTGGLTTIHVNGKAAAMNSTLNLDKKDQLVVSALQRGNYIYVAISGECELPLVFGSYSTYLPAGMGGCKGQALANGSILKTRKPSPSPTIRSIAEIDLPKFSKSQTIRFVPGPETDGLSTPIEGMPFQVAPSSNRIGIRLIGQKLLAREKEIPSSAVVPGTIQLPPSGEPIVLMNDCQTTGGYPRVGKVIDADLGRLAQARQNQVVVFRKVEFAHVAHREAWPR